MSETIIGLTRRVDKISTDFEENISDLKRRYLLENIMAFNLLAYRVSTHRGTFGTGYPYYALDENLNGILPVIKEQIRYNHELLRSGKKSKRAIWACRGCLEKRGKTMPDLKQICKPCPLMDPDLKPRKVINRLPDMDMWFVCEDGTVSQTEQELGSLLARAGFRTSDIDPVRTIDDMQEIVDDLNDGNLPKKFLPIDAHIIEYSALKEMIQEVPDAIQNGISTKSTPYIPILPRSLRKTWQYDDEAYNFIYDFLAGYKEFNFDDELQGALDTSRCKVATTYSNSQLIRILSKVSSKTQIERFKSQTLQRLYLQKFYRWRLLTTPDVPKVRKLTLPNGGDER